MTSMYGPTLIPHQFGRRRRAAMVQAWVHGPARDVEDWSELFDNVANLSSNRLT